MIYRTAGILSIFLLILGVPRGCEDRSCDCLCAAYESEEIFINDTLRLKFNEIYCNPEYEFLIGFDSIRDNRCPLGAVCVWEGNAGITITIKSKHQRYTRFRLNTHERFLTDTLVNGLHYELINVLPYPEINKDYALEDYELLLYISD
jgi:hypothetical protein